MKVKCVVPCRQSDGYPTFFPCEIECSQEEYDNGDHYDMAIDQAKDEDYEVYSNLAVVFDENDGPDWLFKHFWPDPT